METELSVNTKIKTNKNKLLVLGIIFIAINLRAGITSVGPLVSSIRNDLGISNGVAGLITTIPLLSFGIFSPFAPIIARRFSNELTLFAGLIVLIIGLLIRFTGFTVTVFLGTVLIGMGISIGNVLLPSVVKQKFPRKIGLITSMYTTSMGGFAALASGLSIPISEGLHLGWKNTLGSWTILATLALIVWIPQLRNFEKTDDVQKISSSNGSTWRSPLAWQVSTFMGLQSFLFYCTIAWLPAILHSKEMSVSLSGWMLSIMQFVSLPATFTTPILAGRLKNQKAIAAAIGILNIIGFAGLIISEKIPVAILCVLIIGFSQGASISLSFAFFGLRTKNAGQSAELSGMAQSVGYSIAAIGPILIGFLFDKTHSWTLPLITLIIVSIILIIVGIGAGRNKYVEA